MSWEAKIQLWALPQGKSRGKCVPGSLPRSLPWQGLAASTSTAVLVRGRESVSPWTATLKLYFPLIIMMSLTIKWTTFPAFSHTRIAGGGKKRKKGACDVYSFFCGTENNTTLLPFSGSLAVQWRTSHRGRISLDICVLTDFLAWFPMETRVV